MRFIGNYREIALLKGKIEILPYSFYEVRVIANFSFTGLENIENLSSLMTLYFIPAEGAWSVFEGIPAPPFKTVNITNGESVVMDEIYHMSGSLIPGFLISYTIYAVQLTFSNNESVVFYEFSNGKCLVMWNASINNLGAVGGIRPFFKKDGPSLFYRGLSDLSGKLIYTLVNLNVYTGEYSLVIT